LSEETTKHGAETRGAFHLAKIFSLKFQTLQAGGEPCFQFQTCNVIGKSQTLIAQDANKTDVGISTSF